MNRKEFLKGGVDTLFNIINRDNVADRLNTEKKR